MKLKYSVILICLLVFGCKDRHVRTEPCAIVRFDKILFSLDHVRPDISQIDPEYNTFFRMYASGVLMLGDISSPNFPETLSYFLTDTTMNEIYKAVELKYPDMSIQEQELSLAFGQLKYLFPSAKIPQVYTHISGFNQSIIVDSTFIGIGLDNYLGEDCRFYRLLATPIPEYMQKKMTENHIVRDAIYGWLSSEYMYIPYKNDLLSGMLYQGKISYLMEKILPDFPRELIFNFTPEQYKWCTDNEARIWEFLVDQEYLYNAQQMLLVKYLNDAPFTSGMPRESPGQTAVWTGYQIVKKYMKDKHISLEELMKEQDYHKILRLAKYRP